MNISLAAEPIFRIGSFPVTNTLLMSWAVILFLIVITRLACRDIKIVPRGWQNVLEYVIESFLHLIDSVTGDKKQTKKFFPIVVTIFLFVILANWLEIIPGLGTIGLKEIEAGKTIIVPFIRSSSADLNFTIAIAIISVLAVQFLGITSLGFFKYAGKFLVSPFRKPYFIGTFVGLLEAISELSRLISYSFRLFGNIFAGEVLLIVMLFLVPYLVPLPFLFLEIFVGFVQALVFSMLTLVFLKMGCTLQQEH